MVRALLAVALAALPAAAQSFPALARVKANATSVRGTAGDLSPETGRLPAGERVIVLAAEGNDWLAIQPPNGSVSWVPWTLVEPQAKPGPDGKLPERFNAVVTAEDGAFIRPGAADTARPLGVQRTRLPKGSVVQVWGSRTKVKVDGDEQEMFWYPIIAPKEDVRYVRREALEWAGAAPPTPNFVVKAGGSTSKPLPGAAPEAATPGSASKGDFTLSVPNSGDRPQFPTTPNATKPADWPSNYPLWRDAEKARGAGDYKQARELFTKLAQEVSREGPGQDLELANLCYDRIYNTLGGSASGSGSGSGGGAAWRPPAKADPPAGVRVEGRLVATNALLDGKWKIYLLTDEAAFVQRYIVSGGADLDRYVGQWSADRRKFSGPVVEVSGSEIRPDSLRGDRVLVASDVRTK
jgi:hypothetical protein